MAAPSTEPAARVVRTLVVDDAVELRALWADAFTGHGFEVVGQAADGLEATRTAARLRPDLVLLDLAMPVMSGLEALPHLRATCPEAIIVILSGPPGGAMARRARGAGADEYVEKGASVAEVRSRVLKLLEPSRHEAATEEPRSVADIADEIRRPVRGMLGVVSTLRSLERSRGSDLRSHLLESLAEQATALDALTADLLAATDDRPDHARPGGPAPGPAPRQ